MQCPWHLSKIMLLFDRFMKGVYGLIQYQSDHINIIMKFSKIATDMNTKIQNDSSMTVDIELESGETVTCALIIVLTVKDKDYIVLLPLDENGQNDDGNVWFYEFILKSPDAEPELGYISDDEEYEDVADAFDEYLDDVEFDELIELDPEENDEQ